MDRVLLLPLLLAVTLPACGNPDVTYGEDGVIKFSARDLHTPFGGSLDQPLAIGSELIVSIKHIRYATDDIIEARSLEPGVLEVVGTDQHTFTVRAVGTGIGRVRVRTLNVQDTLPIRVVVPARHDLAVETPGDRVLLGGVGSIAVRPLDADGQPMWGVAEHAVEARPAGHAEAVAGTIYWTHVRYTEPGPVTVTIAGAELNRTVVGLDAVDALIVEHRDLDARISETETLVVSAVDADGQALGAIGGLIDIVDETPAVCSAEALVRFPAGWAPYLPRVDGASIYTSGSPGNGLVGIETHAAGPCRITLSVGEHRHRVEFQVRPWS